MTRAAIILFVAALGTPAVAQTAKEQPLCQYTNGETHDGGTVQVGTRIFRVCSNFGEALSGFADSYLRQSFPDLWFEEVKAEAQRWFPAMFRYLDSPYKMDAKAKLLHRYDAEPPFRDFLGGVAYTIYVDRPAPGEGTWIATAFDHVPDPSADANGLPAHRISCHRPVASDPARERCHIAIDYEGGVISSFMRRPCPVCTISRIDRAWFPLWARSLYQMATKLDVTHSQPRPYQ